MISLLACSALLAFGADTVSPIDARRAYEAARGQAGRSPEDQVRLALWCEEHGLAAERLHHLTLAILADPGHATARGLMGMVSRDGRWQHPEAVADRLKADPARVATLAEYELKRQKAAYTADAQWALGLWAEEHGLAEQARAHLTAVTRLDPSRDAAWKKLGYKKHDGRWITDAQLAAGKAEIEAQKLADKKWKPLLERYKAMLGQPSKREEAEAALDEVADPRAVPMIMQVFALNKEADQLRAVRLLGQVESPSASRSLAGLAVLSRSAEVRRGAVETLRSRDPREFVKLWIALVRKPIRFEVRPVGGPGSPGELFVEGERANLRRSYSPPAMPNVPILPGTRMSYDANGLLVLTEPIDREQVATSRIWLPNYSFDGAQVAGAIQQATKGGNLQEILRNQANAGRPAETLTGYTPGFLIDGEFAAPGQFSNDGSGRRVQAVEREKDLRVPLGQMELEAQNAARSSQQQLTSDAAQLERANAATRRSNEPVLLALRSITGRSFGDDPVAWSKWWTENEGYVFAITQATDKPTIAQDVTPAYVPQAIPQVIDGPLIPIVSHSCFAAGTTVRTVDGDRPIESIRAGDLVLVQDTRSGALGYQAVVTAFHNPPSPTLRVKLGELDSVVATGIHRFWKAGRGWTMARDLKPGDLVRTLGGSARVSAVEAERTQPVFNLEVAEGHSFLVGKLGALVHDNSLVEATLAPFDAPSRPSK